MRLLLRSVSRLLIISKTPPRRNQPQKWTELIITRKNFIQTCPRIFQNNRDNAEGNKSRTDEDDDDNDEYDRLKSRKRDTSLSIHSYFDSEKKNKETYQDMIEIYKHNNPARRGHVEFIYAALKHMDEFGVAHDLDTYKKLIKILPEGKFVPENFIQEEFMHYPKQQDCVVTVLDYMESKGVIPDVDLEHTLRRIFGRKGEPLRKVWRMLYWMPKFKNASPWPVPNPPPKDTFILAKMAIERIVSVDPQSSVSVYQTESVPDALDHTYIVSGQSEAQRRLLRTHPKTEALFIEGAFRIWLRSACVNYFILRSDPPKDPKVELQDPDDVSNLRVPFLQHMAPPKALVHPRSVHEQDDGTILAVCATGTSSRDSLLSWIRLLEQNGNPALADIPVLFNLKSPLGDIVVVDGAPVPPNEEPEKLESSKR